MYHNRFFIGVFLVCALHTYGAGAATVQMTEETIQINIPENSVDTLTQKLNKQSPSNEKVQYAKENSPAIGRYVNLTHMAYHDLALAFVSKCNDNGGYAYIEHFGTNNNRYDISCITPNAITLSENADKSYKSMQNVFSTECTKLQTALSDFSGAEKQIIDDMRINGTDFNSESAQTRYYATPCVITVPNTAGLAIVQTLNPLSEAEVSSKLSAMKTKCEKYNNGNVHGVWVVNNHIEALATHIHSAGIQKAYCVFVDKSKTEASRTAAINSSNAKYQSMLNDFVAKVSAKIGDSWAYAPDTSSRRCQDIFTTKKKCQNVLTGRAESTPVIAEWLDISSGDECRYADSSSDVTYNGQNLPMGKSGNYTACEFSVFIRKN